MIFIQCTKVDQLDHLDWPRLELPSQGWITRSTTSKADFYKKTKAKICFFFKWAIPGPFFLLFVFSIQLIIRTADLWCSRKRPIYQLSHNHFPKSKDLFVFRRGHLPHRNDYLVPRLPASLGGIGDDNGNDPIFRDHVKNLRGTMFYVCQGSCLCGTVNNRGKVSPTQTGLNIRGFLKRA